MVECEFLIMKIFIKNVVDATPHFSAPALSDTGQDLLILMPISTFLSVARRIKGGDLHLKKAEAVRTLLESGTVFNSTPFLKTEVVDATIHKVIGHEGRHRAMALSELGYSHIPVRIKSTSVIWEDQADPTSPTYLQNWPTKLQGEHKNLIPFPFPRPTKEIE